MLEALVAIGQILGLARAVESIQRLWSKWRQKPVAETLAGRFLRLFEAHGVHRNQIPRFFGHGLQFKDVQDEVALLPCLTDEHLADACQLFGVERQWLERGEGNAHVRHHFYLRPQAFGIFLDELLAARKGLQDVELKAELFGVPERQSQVDSTLLIAQPIGLLNDDVIYRYHQVDGGPLGYWKSRVSNSALVAQALARNLWISGRLCNARKLSSQTYEADLWDTRERDALMMGSRHMDVEDWLLEPQALLEGVDPEANRFGIISALELWLKLEAQGLMEHPFAKPDRREVFQASLEAEKTV
jgi:hypothetical protein